MPPAAVAIPVDVAVPAVGMGAGLIGGGLQKVAWEVSTPLGFITTSVMAIGGVVGSFMVEEGIGAAALRGMGIAGATIAGWQATERFMIPAHAPERRLTEEQRQAALAAARERAALNAGTRLDLRGDRQRERERVPALLEF